MDINKYLLDLEKIVNIDSGHNCFDGMCEIVDFFKTRFEKLGWICEKYDVSDTQGPCLVCKNKEATHYDLLLLGHLDTVFEKGTAQRRPFRIENGFAYGPGVSDMKQGSLLMYYLAQDFPKEVHDNLNIIAIFNPDEERTSIFSAPVFEKYAPLCEYAFLYEGSGNNHECTIQRKGMRSMYIKFEGVDGHCGYVFTNGARSAISEMARWIVRLDSLQSRERNTTVNIGVVSGGTVGNVVARYAEMKVNVRFDFNKENELVEETVKELLAQAEQNGIKVEFIYDNFTPALVPTEKTHAFIENAKKVAEKIGILLKTKPSGGLSDANHVAKYGVTCVDSLGPTGEHCHSDREYLRLDTIEPAYKLSMALICDMAKNK